MMDTTGQPLKRITKWLSTSLTIALGWAMSCAALSVPLRFTEFENNLGTQMVPGSSMTWLNVAELQDGTQVNMVMTLLSDTSGGPIEVTNDGDDVYIDVDNEGSALSMRFEFVDQNDQPVVLAPSFYVQDLDKVDSTNWENLVIHEDTLVSYFFEGDEDLGSELTLEIDATSGLYTFGSKIDLNPHSSVNSVQLQLQPVSTFVLDFIIGEDRPLSWFFLDGNAEDRFSEPTEAVIDQTPPVAPVITTPEQNAVFTDAQVSIGGTAESNNWVSVFEGTDLVCTTISTPAGYWSCDGNFALGSHTVFAEAMDFAQNQSSESNSVTFSVVSNEVVEAPATETPDSKAPSLNTGVTGTGSFGWWLVPVLLLLSRTRTKK